MAELSKEVKIVFIINAIPAFIYAFLFLVIPDIYAQITKQNYITRSVYGKSGQVF